MRVAAVVWLTQAVIWPFDDEGMLASATPPPTTTDAAARPAAKPTAPRRLERMLMGTTP